VLPPFFRRRFFSLTRHRATSALCSSRQSAGQAASNHWQDIARGSVLHTLPIRNPVKPSTSVSGNAIEPLRNPVSTALLHPTHQRRRHLVREGPMAISHASQLLARLFGAKTDNNGSWTRRPG